MPSETESFGFRIKRALKMLNTVKSSGCQRPSFTFAYDPIDGYVVEVNGVENAPTFETATEALDFVDVMVEDVIKWKQKQIEELKKAMEPTSNG